MGLKEINESVGIVAIAVPAVKLRSSWLRFVWVALAGTRYSNRVLISLRLPVVFPCRNAAESHFP